MQLHDATLLSVMLKWSESVAELALLLGSNLPATLAFQGVTYASLPREQPWGPSDSINKTRSLPVGEYAVEMQSGDVLVFRAASWSLSITAAPSEA